MYSTVPELELVCSIAMGRGIYKDFDTISVSTLREPCLATVRDGVAGNTQYCVELTTVTKLHPGLSPKYIELLKNFNSYTTRLAYNIYIIISTL